MTRSTIAWALAIAIGLGGLSLQPGQVHAEDKHNFGDFTSEALTTKAWNALNDGAYEKAQAFAKKCIELYRSKAEEQVAELSDFAPDEEVFTYWAMNDVATSYFILGESYRLQAQENDARAAYTTVFEEFPYAQAWDTRGWFWKVAEGASDKLVTIGTAHDFGDYRSETLTTRAWEALAKNDHTAVELYARKVFELYEDDAKNQQASLTDFVDPDKKEEVFKYWALNDVATSYFILGESLIARERFEEAKAAFRRIINDFTVAQCWDTKGWFWKVAKGAQDRIDDIDDIYLGGG